jgi:hypothetical protein
MKERAMVALRGLTIRLLLGATLWAFAPGMLADAAAPAGRYVVSGGTVYDTKTKLTWQQQTTATNYSWADAKTYCSSAAVSSLGGVGWRLPTIKEWFTLIDFSRTSGVIDPTVFPGTLDSSHFWSATPVAGTTNKAWIEYAGSGAAFAEVTANYDLVKCVR